MPDRSEESRWRRIWAYVGALREHLVAFITSGVVATVAALGVNAFGVDIPNWIYAAVFVWFGVLVASFLAWEEQYEIARRLAEGPKLSLYYDADDPRCASRESENEMLCVGVLNEGTQRAEGVHLMLEEIDPPKPELLHKRFLVDEGDTFEVSPTQGRPALYVPVLSQKIHATHGYTQVVLAKRRKPLPGGTRRARLVLRLEADRETEPLVLDLVADNRGKLQASTS